MSIDAAPIRELPAAEGRKILDEAAFYWLGISGDEFLRGLKAGAYRGREEDLDVSQLLMLAPLGRADR